MTSDAATLVRRNMTTPPLPVSERRASENHIQTTLGYVRITN
jgi:hypothetical protein